MVIYGALGLPENDRSLVSNVGEMVVYDAAEAFIQRHNADIEAAYSVFVEGTTEGNKDYYKLPGGGRLQRLGTRSRSGASRAGGKWDVAYPLEQFGSAFETDETSFAYLTVEQLANELATIRTQDVNTIRFEILATLMDNNNRTFIDEFPMNPGTLTIRTLANGDGTTYPPVIGAEDGAGDDHFLTSGYTAANLNDDNNPYLVIRAELEEHFGTPDGFGSVVAFINTDEVAATESLADFVEVSDTGINYGDDTDLAAVPPEVARAPGRTIGRVSGVWVKEWRHIPSGYILGIDMMQPGPCKLRVHPANTGLPQGLALRAEDSKYPIRTRHYQHDMGVGCGNRLNGVVMQLTTNASYTPPAIYTR